MVAPACGAVNSDRLQHGDRNLQERHLPGVGLGRPDLHSVPHRTRVHDTRHVLTRAYRPYWRCYYENATAVIYVVDSSDSERLNISKDELMAMLNVRSTPAAGVPFV